MQTKLIRADEPTALADAARCLAGGGLVVFPTETVYGLGANALDEAAVRSIFTAKGRPSDNPLIVHIHDVRQLDGLVSAIPPMAQRLMDALWPGPLTLVLPRSGAVPDVVTAGLATVAVRMPSHPVAQALLRLANIPVAAPSANTSTRPSPTTAQHVADDLWGKVDYIVDGGACDVGVESTVVDVTGERPVILRPGGVPKEALEAACGMAVHTDPGLTKPDAVPKSPGMKYKHYAPRCEMAVVTGAHIQEGVTALLEENTGKRIGVLTAGPHTYPGVAYAIDGGADPASYAHTLFAALRDMEAHGVELIVAELPFGEDGLAPAVRNRIRKSAGGNVIET